MTILRYTTEHVDPREAALRESLHEAIKDELYDRWSTDRLVLADWLEERGDPLALAEAAMCRADWCWGTAACTWGSFRLRWRPLSVMTPARRHPGYPLDVDYSSWQGRVNDRWLLGSAPGELKCVNADMHMNVIQTGQWGRALETDVRVRLKFTWVPHRHARGIMRDTKRHPLGFAGFWAQEDRA